MAYAQLNVPRGHVRVLGAFLAGGDLSDHREDELGANGAGRLVGVWRVVWMDDNLNDAATVAQVHEDQTAVVAATVHPTAQRDFLTDVLFA